MKDGTVRAGGPDYYPSAETVAGDFDGDGKTEIAVVFKDDTDEKYTYVFGQLNVTIYKWDNNSGSFASATQNISVNDHDRHQTQYYDDEWWTNFLGLKAVRYDYDGEGKDGIAVLLLAHQKLHEEMDGHGKHNYEHVCPYFMYWYCDQGTITPKYATLNREGTQYFDGDGIYTGSLGAHGTICMFGDTTRGKKGVFYYDQGFEGNALSGSYPYVDRSFTLASGPFLGQVGTFKTIDDLAVCWSIKQPEDPGRETDGRRRDNAYIFKTNHTDDGRFIGVSPGANVYQYVQDTENDKSALVAADFLGEGVELEEPVHLKVEGERTYAAILQTTPYHVDNIPVPWDSDQTPKVTNFTYSTELKTSYTHESTSEAGQDVTFDMKGSAETVEAIGMDGTTTAIVKKVASFALEKGAGIKGAGAILDSLVDKVDTTKSESNKSSIKKALTDKVETSTSDRVLYYSTNVHMWRYPVKEPAPSWLFTKIIEGDESSVSGDKFLTFSMADDPVFHTTAGLEDECYQPLHEEGNLFSYPSSLAYIPGYIRRTLELTGQSSITYSPGSHTQTVTVTQEAASQTTETRKVKYGIISNLVGTVQVLHGDATENSMSGERGNSSTFTKSYSTTDTLTASFPNPEGDYANVTFTTDLQAYADEAGILTLGFAVSDFGSTARLWQSSIYNEKPDPALYLPYKYYFSGNTVIARDDERVATKMRGVRFYIPDAAQYSGSALYAGETYRIEIPIYNASFVAPDGTVDVALSFRDAGGSETTLIAREAVTISGWESGKDSNKAVVSFDWTVPEDMAGAKELVAEIDPDNTIDEVHEGWDPDVPGGNNFGYFPFSVVKAESLPFKAPANSDIVLTIDGMSMSDFIGYAAGQTKAFDAECVITNNGGSMMLALLELNLLASGDETVQSLTHNVGLMNTSEKHSYKFLVKPENWKSCDELEAVFYTDSGILRKSASKSPEDEPEDQSRGVGSSNGGCDAGLSALGLGLILSAVLIRRRLR